MRKALRDIMRKRKNPGRSMGPAGASTVSKDGKRMKTRKKPSAKDRQLEKLKDMRNKVMGTQKVMTAAMGGRAKKRLSDATAEAKKRMKKAGKTAGKGIGLLGKLGGVGVGAAAKAFQKAKQRKPSGRLTADDLKRARPKSPFKPDPKGPTKPRKPRRPTKPLKPKKPNMLGRSPFGLRKTR